MWSSSISVLKYSNITTRCQRHASHVSTLSQDMSRDLALFSFNKHWLEIRYAHSPDAKLALRCQHSPEHRQSRSSDHEPVECRISLLEAWILVQNRGERVVSCLGRRSRPSQYPLLINTANVRPDSPALRTTLHTSGLRERSSDHRSSWRRKP